MSTPPELNMKAEETFGSTSGILREWTSSEINCIDLQAAAKKYDNQNNEHAASIPTTGSADFWEHYILKDMVFDLENGSDKGLRFDPEPVSDQIPEGSKFFVIKSYNAADVVAAHENHCWSSTALGNKRLDKAFASSQGAPVYLFFSVNGSGCFCAVAQMTGAVDFEKHANCWSDPKWKGSFPIRFLHVKDIQNRFFKYLCIPMVKNGVQCISSVTTSRDTQALPYDVGVQMMNIFALHPPGPSILSSTSGSW